MFLFPEYSFSDMYHNIKGGKASLKMLDHGGFWELKLDQNAMDFKIPVYIVMGETDYTTPIPLAEAYFKNIKAPDKKYFVIPNSAHLANMENPVLFNKYVIQVFNRH